MRETLVIKYFLVVMMLAMAVLSFYEIAHIDSFLYKVFMFLSGGFFLYHTIWILRIKAK